MSEKTIIEGMNFFRALKPESMGVVNDVRFVKCFWPKLDMPTPLFADGSSGIEVQGPPTPRNVIFPPDTVFLEHLSADNRVLALVHTSGDTFFSSEQVLRDVEEQVEATKTLEVEPGVMQEVRYMKTITVQKMVEDRHPLDGEQAAQVAGLDREKVEPIKDGVK